jgi:hypothetical protein
MSCSVMSVAINLKSLGIDKLSVDDRLALTQAQRDELDRRLADHLSRPTDGISREQLQRSIDVICPR